MGFGAYLAAKSEREIFEAEYAGEREVVGEKKRQLAKYFLSAIRFLVFQKKMRNAS